MKNKIRVVVWGLGSMGSGIAKMVLSKKGFTIVGAIDMDPNKVGKKLYEVLGVKANEDNSCIVTKNAQDVIKKSFADVCLMATASFTKVVFPLIKMAAEAGMDIVTTAEEMSYPRAMDPKLSDDMDRIAKENKISILGTGVNPGFIMDLVAIMLTGVSDTVDSIKATRVNDLACFGKAVMVEQGIGLKPEQFIQGVKDNTVDGHVGFMQSFGMFEEAFNIKFNNIRQEKSPIVTTVPRSTDIVSVEAGEVAGCSQLGYASLGDKVFATMEHPQQIRPELENVDTGDYITIKGVPNLNLQIKPEIPGGIATIAICVNMIPLVMNSEPGLKTMLDLPVPRAIIGDVRNLVK
ncbi:2,4-diaminopentanoate dehydrogenase [Clostridium estertheticum]|uniref:Dihydrodipicolinate reductase n=1 Tax=Clostridium estertheticum subsp. estertheticum TaxID=1552 RepID=A0A1J0GKU0_9CLOT|nr:2,4-diaminopentanoate dehydrogenase [Clostridium estertheticum]APC41576.1 dihydrodipicolinate reductase [Clostridium estertheticum subsp. estertheticum]MBU3072758.1 NADP-binding protein [Clostridium estertheticum]MBU3163205.1 NADP-binding protein [Clostridium estertheticum]MBW9169619.1 NADP-binding protein [Clostridium estertheticum]MBZ9616562.1 NADP-binding protein [Clostridium estertheticum subsp. laramiense]